MRALNLALAAAGALFLPAHAAAQAPEPLPERYRIERTDSGFLRMDMHTGEISSCEERSGRLTCRPVIDEKPAADLAELDRRVDELERRVRALENRTAAEANLPSEEEFERTMSLMERFLRRFWGVAKDLERKSGSEGQAPQPGRT